MPRILVIGAVVVLCLAGGVMPAAAQETPASPIEGVTVEPMFVVDLGEEALPEELAGVLVFHKVYPIDMEIAYTGGFVPPNTFVRYVESGQLGVKPHAAMTIIRGADGASTTEAVAPEAETIIGPGDTFVQSDVPYDQYASGALGTMWHEGDADAVVYGFAIRESSRCCSMTHAGMVSPWHDTITAESLAPLIGKPITVSMERLRLDPGATLPLSADQPPTMWLVEAGTVTASVPGEGDPAARSLEYATGRSFSDLRMTRDLGFLMGHAPSEPPVLANLGAEPLGLLRLVIRAAAG
jgi:hypothetical protein